MLLVKKFPDGRVVFTRQRYSQTVPSSTDLGIVGENEMLEKGENVVIANDWVSVNAGFRWPSRNRWNIPGPEFFNGKRMTSYPSILKKYLAENNLKAEVHVITGSVEIAPGIGLADAIFDIVSSGSTLGKQPVKRS